MKRTQPRLVLIVSFDHGDVNEIPVDEWTVLTLRSERTGPLTTISLKGVRTLVLTEAMDGLDNKFALAPSAESKP